MAPWYEEAEFYHIYPIGLTGAPRKNESEETVKMLKQKMQLINGCMKFLVLTQNESYKVVQLTTDFIDSYIASVALIASHAKRAV